jgi:D-glycero-D-manno-heptose 1,7-bisphosphate phosphatase
VITVPVEIDGKGHAARRWEDFAVYGDAAESIDALKQHGFRVVVVTNQPDISNGLVPARLVEEFHAELQASLRIDRIHTCPHSSADGCNCRKPLAGLLDLEAEYEPVDFSRSWMVGDRDSDVAAGRAAGCRTVFIDRGWRDETGSRADIRVVSLADAVQAILGSSPREMGEAQ